MRELFSALTKRSRTQRHADAGLKPVVSCEAGQKSKHDENVNHKGISELGEMQTILDKRGIDRAKSEDRG